MLQSEESFVDDAGCHQSFRRKLRAVLGLGTPTSVTGGDNSSCTMSSDNLSECCKLKSFICNHELVFQTIKSQTRMSYVTAIHRE